MTDKPDGAALIEWLQTWSPVTANGKRAHLAASELTRLAAEHRDQQQVVLDLMNERDEAKAEIARLTDYNARLHADIAEIGKDNDELEAEIARLRDTIDGLLGEIQEMRDAALKPDTGE